MKPLAYREENLYAAICSTEEQCWPDAYYTTVQFTQTFDHSMRRHSTAEVIDTLSRAGDTYYRMPMRLFTRAADELGFTAVLSSAEGADCSPFDSPEISVFARPSSGDLVVVEHYDGQLFDASWHLFRDTGFDRDAGKVWSNPGDPEHHVTLDRIDVTHAFRLKFSVAIDNDRLRPCPKWPSKDANGKFIYRLAPIHRMMSVMETNLVANEAALSRGGRSPARFDGSASSVFKRRLEAISDDWIDRLDLLGKRSVEEAFADVG